MDGWIFYFIGAATGGTLSFLICKYVAYKHYEEKLRIHVSALDKEQTKWIQTHETQYSEAMSALQHEQDRFVEDQKKFYESKNAWEARKKMLEADIEHLEKRFIDRSVADSLTAINRIYRQRIQK